ncbi:MAG TPA: hypothetical protein VGM11_05395, partial [Acidobacteriaceae bacterium]
MDYQLIADTSRAAELSGFTANLCKEQHISRPVKLEASVACAHLTRLETDLRELKDAGIDLLHIDIMDGRFVNNFCLDFSMMEA